MKCIRSALLVLISLCVFIPAHANEVFLNHVKATSQAMSAFYMQILSEGNEKYLNEFEVYKHQSLGFITQYAKDKAPQSQQLLKRWQDLSDRLTLTLDKEYGWEVDGRVREDFRGYLSDIYQMVDQQKNSYTKKDHRQLLSVVQMEAISARFFDISSLFNVKVSIFASDKEKLDPTNINHDFKANLATLANMSDSRKVKRRLASAKSKWEFVEKSVVDYQGHGAYFVVYATKNKIQRSLASL